LFVRSACGFHGRRPTHSDVDDCQTAPRPLDDETTKAIARTLDQESRHYVAPIYWSADPYDAYSLMHNASCCFLQIGSRRFGVTAHHVNAEYLWDRDAHPTAHLMIRNTEVSRWDARQIAGDSSLDIATFEVTDWEFEEIAARCFDWPADKRPPPPPEKDRGDRGVLFTGHAGVDRRIVSRKAIEFGQTSDSLVPTSCGPDELAVQCVEPISGPLPVRLSPASRRVSAASAALRLWSFLARPDRLVELSSSKSSPRTGKTSRSPSPAAHLYRQRRDAGYVALRLTPHNATRTCNRPDNHARPSDRLSSQRRKMAKQISKPIVSPR
jgi:hypothetical protein